MDLGERLTRLRTERGLNQAEAAQAIGISASSLSRLERGRRGKRPTPATMERVARYFGVPVHYLTAESPQEYIRTWMTELPDKEYTALKTPADRMRLVLQELQERWGREFDRASVTGRLGGTPEDLELLLDGTALPTPQFLERFEQVTGAPADFVSGVRDYARWVAALAGERGTEYLALIAWMRRQGLTPADAQRLLEEAKKMTALWRHALRAKGSG